jgi:hypothetical protein
MKTPAVTRGAWTSLVWVLLTCLVLATSGHVWTASSLSLIGTIDVASGNVTVQEKTDAGALMVVNERQFKVDTTGAFSASLPSVGAVTITVVGESRSCGRTCVF